MGEKKALWSKGLFTLYPRELRVTGDRAATDSQIKSIASDVLQSRDSSAWGIGDLAVYAESIGKSSGVDTVVEDVVRDRHWVRKCYYVSKAIEPDARTFDLWWAFYYAVYRFPADARDRMLSLAVKHKWSIEEFNAHLKSVRHTVREKMQTFPEGTYGLVYADPPWRYDNGGRGAAINHYEDLDVEEIKTLTDGQGRSVKDVAAPDSILYLWATTALLPEALDVMASWGFEYKSSMVWVKDIQGLGTWARSRHEFLLIGTRGKVVPPAEALRPDSVIQEPRGEHSEKPEICYDMLETMYRPLPKIELFARTAREGWDRWGNEAPPAAAESNVVEMPPAVNTDGAEVDAQTGEAAEAGEVAEMRQKAHGKKRKPEPKARVSESAASKKSDPPKPRLVKPHKRPA